MATRIRVTVRGGCAEVEALGGKRPEKYVIP